jgi:hypothetical protein
MNHNYLAATNCAFGVQASPASFLLFPRAALVVIHKSLKSCHSGRDCRKPEHRDVSARNQAIPRCKAYHLIQYCHPWLLGNYSMHCSTSCILAVVDPGNPCRDDGVSQTLVYNDERAAWECGTGRAAPRIHKTLIVTRGAARLDCIPTQRVGTRLQ